MITLNTDKGLIKVESWDDIRSRPGFAIDLNPAEHALESIIGRYIFKDKIRCGLSNCHTPHAKGYIVVTKDGQETNIGKDCGKTYFGVDFETLSRKFDRDITEKENREKLWSFSFQLEELKARITELREAERGADWVYRNTRPLVFQNKGCPDEVVRRVSTMVKTRQGILSTQRVATAQEIENLEAIQGRKLPKPYYIDEPIAEIAGIIKANHHEPSQAMKMPMLADGACATKPNLLAPNQENREPEAVLADPGSIVRSKFR